MADAVEDDLGDGALAVGAFLAGFVIDGAGQALERAGTGRRIDLAEREGRSGRVRAAIDRNMLVDRQRLVDWKLADEQRRRRGRCFSFSPGADFAEGRRRIGRTRDGHDPGKRKGTRQDHFLWALAP